MSNQIVKPKDADGEPFWIGDCMVMNCPDSDNYGETVAITSVLYGIGRITIAGLYHNGGSFAGFSPENFRKETNDHHE